MYGKTSEAQQFASREASKSVRPFVGGWSDQGDPKAFLSVRTVRQQYDDLRADLTKKSAELAHIRDGLNGRRALVEGETIGNLRERHANVQRRVAALKSQRGHLGKTLREANRLAFETIFATVAQHRLSRDAFLVLVEEAREIWRAEGFADLEPGPTNRQRKKQRKRNRKAFLDAA